MPGDGGGARAGDAAAAAAARPAGEAIGRSAESELARCGDRPGNDVGCWAAIGSGTGTTRRVHENLILSVTKCSSQK